MGSNGTIDHKKRWRKNFGEFLEGETEANDNRSLFFMTGIKIEKKKKQKEKTDATAYRGDEEVDARSRWTERESEGSLQ